MRHTSKLLIAALAVPLFTATAQVQQGSENGAKGEPPRAKTDSGRKDSTSALAIISTVPTIEIQHFRPADQRGLNMFEPPKKDEVPYTGFKLSWGAAFTQQFQGLQHSNAADAKLVNNVDQNKLIGLGHGFNNAVANLYLNAQLAKGIRVAVVSYASARHHQETWVKEGYALIDDSPIDLAPLNAIMQYTTLKVGHFEIDYGDAHYRRSDNGQAMFNPFVGNYILDAFTTEIGGQVYFRTGPWLAMGGITGGEVKGMVTTPEKRSPAYVAKLGIDESFTPKMRVRLTGSMYAQDASSSNTLFTGDRAGSRYYDVLENTASTETAQAWSGNIRPGFANSVHSYVVNPFVKLYGVELFGNIETATGKASTELTNRTIRQYAGEGIYRFWSDKLYLGGRYNTVRGELAGVPNDVAVNRVQLGGGWFVTPLLLTKVEWVNQKYEKFPTSDIRSGGQFKGFMVEGTIAF
jgi:hypothetical protein